VLDREIEEIFDLGVDFKPHQTLGREITLDGLQRDGFDALFLGVGAQLSRRISIEGVDLPEVLWGVDFLSEIARGKEIKLKESVIVIGGGNVAVDVALSALRCGAGEVTMACLESREEMPAHEWEIEGAVAEGVKVMPSWGPERILSRDGKVTGVDLVRCTSVFDEKGNFCPYFDETRETIEADQVIMAVGQASDLSFIETGKGIGVENDLIIVDQKTLETGMEGVYAGGDVADPMGAVIHAVAAGRRAASSIDVALGGKGDIEETLFEPVEASPYLGRDEGFAEFPRKQVPEIDMNMRHMGFEEVALGFGAEQAVKEAKRCLQCDLRLLISSNPSPPEKWLPFEEALLSQVP
jgi:NADPH-dependent glutamate synthase beta subunit-like oxidoreductase